MRQFRASYALFLPVATVLLAVFSQGCTKWTEVPAPKNLVTEPRKTVRLTLTGDAKKMTVKNPTVVGDSIVWKSPEPGSVHVSQVAWIEARGMDPVATGFFALAGVTFILVKTLRD
jgi:hypothetical protein